MGKLLSSPWLAFLGIFHDYKKRFCKNINIFLLLHEMNIFFFLLLYLTFSDQNDWKTYQHMKNHFSYNRSNPITSSNKALLLVFGYKTKSKFLSKSKKSNNKAFALCSYRNKIIFALDPNVNKNPKPSLNETARFSLKSNSERQWGKCDMCQIQ